MGDDWDKERTCTWIPGAKAEEKELQNLDTGLRAKAGGQDVEFHTVLNAGQVLRWSW